MTDPTASRLFAATTDGTRLPVLDITNPAFEASWTDAEIDEMIAKGAPRRGSARSAQRLFIGLMLRLLARNSRLIGALRAADDTYLGGISTYVLKLGPANLVPPYDSEIDRQVVKAPLVAWMRLRLSEMATLAAEGLASELRARPGAPLHLLEIAGGPSADALNALILLDRAGAAGGAAGARSVSTTSMRMGPAFAANMLAALKMGPLGGCDIEMAHVTGSWAETGKLRDLLADVPPDAIVAAMSEGGWFEYGSDSEIAGVLKMLAPRVGIVVGSVTRNDRLNQLIRRHSRAVTVPRGLERFAQLIAPTGYRIARSMPSPLSAQVLLDEILSEGGGADGVKARHYRIAERSRTSAEGGTRSGTITVCMPAARAARTPECEILDGQAIGGHHAQMPRREQIGLGVRLGVDDIVARDDRLEHVEQPRGAEVRQRMRRARRGRNRHRDAARFELAQEFRDAGFDRHRFRHPASCISRAAFGVEQLIGGSSPHRPRPGAGWWPRDWSRPSCHAPHRSSRSRGSWRPPRRST